MSLSRHSPNQQDRIEWQLNQIRTNTLVVALFFLLALIGTFLAVIANSSA